MIVSWGYSVIMTFSQGYSVIVTVRIGQFLSPPKLYWQFFLKILNLGLICPKYFTFPKDALKTLKDYFEQLKFGQVLTTSKDNEESKGYLSALK